MAEEGDENPTSERVSPRKSGGTPKKSAHQAIDDSLRVTSKDNLLGRDEEGADASEADEEAGRHAEDGEDPDDEDLKSEDQPCITPKAAFAGALILVGCVCLVIAGVLAGASTGAAAEPPSPPMCDLVRGIQMPGLGGPVSLVRSQRNTKDSEPLPSLSLEPSCAGSAGADGCLEQSSCSDGRVEARFGSRSYILPGAESVSACSDKHFNETFEYGCVDYAAGKMTLSGKTLSFEVDLSGAGCGCNVALYLVSMPQSTDASVCNDFYCDANNVCGVTCAEIDLMEANNVAFVSTVHVADDGNGEGYGLGHYVMHKDNRFSGADAACPYGPSEDCTIDTRRAFKVSYAFAGPGEPFGFTTTLQQGISQTVNTGLIKYTQTPSKGEHDVEEANELLRQRLDAGMTLVLSHWAGEQRKNMNWLDGPCNDDELEWCTDGFTEMFGAHPDWTWGCQGDEQELPPECPAAVVLTDMTIS